MSNLNLDFEIQQHSGSIRHVINIIIWIRDTVCYNMSSALSAQPWDTSHLNVPTRRVTKQSSLEDKEVYLREGALLTKKKTTI
jgi:hypothetical protein